jgi:cyclopropane-fatty-acyl-phospholipid synthase
MLIKMMYWMFNKILSVVAKQYLVWKISNLPVSIYSPDNKPIKHAVDGLIDVHILDESVFCDVLVHGELGLGRAYVEGKWTTNDLEGLMVLLVKNMDVFSRELLHSWNPFAFNLFKKNKNDDKKQITHHYDNGNTFYSMFLDPVFMAYSAGVWKKGDDMVSSAKNKIDLVIEKLDIKASDNVLDIGCGWGMIANYVYEKTRCSLTGLSISDEQIAYSKEHSSKDIVFVNRDYRDIIGKYDKIYSIEMLEHVGRQNYQEYFKTMCESLKPGGKASIQISVSTQEGSEPYLQSQFILTDVFPGGHIPRISWVMEAVSKVPGLRLTGIEFIDGHHFEKTFRGWNKSLGEHSAVIDKKLLRLYEYYFSSCVGLYNNNVLASCVFVFEKDTA